MLEIVKNLVIYYIRRVFQNRNNIKKNTNGETNQLFIHDKLPYNIVEEQEYILEFIAVKLLFMVMNGDIKL